MFLAMLSRIRYKYDKRTKVQSNNVRTEKCLSKAEQNTIRKSLYQHRYYSKLCK